MRREATRMRQKRRSLPRGPRQVSDHKTTQARPPPAPSHPRPNPFPTCVITHLPTTNPMCHYPTKSSFFSFPITLFSPLFSLTDSVARRGDPLPLPGVNCFCHRSLELADWAEVIFFLLISFSAFYLSLFFIEFEF